MKLPNKILPAMVISLLSLGGQAQASSLSLGVSLNGTGWSGDNGAGNSSFESDNGGQLGFSLSFSKDRWYVGLSLQGGEYEFSQVAPTQFRSDATQPTQNLTVNHSDFDLLAGYYVWDRISLFIDLKAVGTQWQNNDYEQGFGGLGLGISGYHPLNENWTLYGSWGVVGGKISEKNNTELGDAGSSAFTIGASYKLNPLDRLSMGLKLRSYQYDFDNGESQQNDLAGIFFGYNHAFEF
jgi:hypothetical protein